MCNCITIEFGQSPNTNLSFQVEAAGTYNGQNYWTFVYYGTTYYLWSDAGNTTWYISVILGTLPAVSELKAGGACPIAPSGTWITVGGYTQTTACTGDCGEEDRMFFEYKSIKLPKICTDENRGFEECCCEELVLAKSTSNTWENDKTSAWMKLSDPADTVTFDLYKDGALTTYIPSSVQFPNESNAYYTTIDWNDVLVSDGIGCYELKISYDISGIQGLITWGKYRLLPFTIQNAIATARIRAQFDGYHEIEQIDFTDSGVESTYRFNGFIGNRQPNTEIDNIIYNNREMKRVIRENLNEYEILVDPALKCVTKPLVDLYLLSENNLYISDYNAHNHDYCINDLPVIVSQSPELTYYDFARKASLKCVVADKFKNKRTYY